MPFKVLQKKMFNSKYIFFILFLLIILQCNADKKENKNEKKKKSNKFNLQDYYDDLRMLEKPFRMAKSNMFWERATKALDDRILEDFYYELLVHDARLFNWKHKRDKDFNGKDMYVQPRLMHDLVEFMEKYELLRYEDDDERHYRDQTCRASAKPRSFKPKPSTTPEPPEPPTSSPHCGRFSEVYYPSSSPLCQQPEAKPKKKEKKSVLMKFMVHDENEPKDYKELNAQQQQDEHVLRLMDLMHTLSGITMTREELLEHLVDTPDPNKIKAYKKYHEYELEDYMDKSMFQDRRLIELWEKAEQAGYGPHELKTLKAEFLEHQDKINTYFSLLKNLKTKNPKLEIHENSVDLDIDLEDFVDNNDEMQQRSFDTNIYHSSNLEQLRTHHQRLKNNYERLERMVLMGPHSQDFFDPTVQDLWKKALVLSKFTPQELEMLKIELHHLQSRLLKLRHLRVQRDVQKHKYKNKDIGELEEQLKRLTRKAEIVEADIEKRIKKHSRT